MILYGGRLYDTKEQDRLIDGLDERINRTLSEKTLDPEKVISAAEKLRSDIAAGEFDDILFSLGLDDPERYRSLALTLLEKASLEKRLEEELGKRYRDGSRIASVVCPLGVLFHIAAGNMDGLPAMSIAEGLLTGNVNILKLPSADSGLSVKIISRLTEYEPEIADFIYVFDTPSSDIRAMQRLAETADGIVVWGGEAAVKAVRTLAPVGAKLIEWGHKLGFCYISGIDGIEDDLYGLATHIAVTKQLLCSSCQTIFIDTDDDGEVRRFCSLFLPILEKAAAEHSNMSVGMRARRTLLDHTERLEEIIGAKSPDPDEFRGKGCRLLIRTGAPELSPMMCSVIVKKLPRRNIVPVLREARGFLQTAGLICPDDERAAFTDLLTRSGVTRVTRAADMSEYFPGEAHDGEYPLRRYTRVVNIQENA